MLVMGIESSAHTFGVGIVKDGKVLSNEKEMYDVGTAGMVPYDVASFHIQNATKVVSRAIKSAKIRIEQIEGIGYTKGPGLGPCLQVGELTAKAIAKGLEIRIAPVNHGTAHAEMSRSMAKMKDPTILYVSGGNSQILKLSKHPHLHYRILGETFDIGVGNMFDAFARSARLKPAWGSRVAQLAKNGKYIPMPYTVKGMDFSFTGLLTRSIELMDSNKIEDLCFSIQETSFSMLCEATERALLLNSSKELCVCGGVAQSERLREMLGIIAKDHGVRFGYAKNEFNADNGAMIAFVAERMIKNGADVPLKDCNVEQKYRIDDAVVY